MTSPSTTSPPDHGSGRYSRKAVRRNMVYFALGKVFSAGLSFAILGLVATKLSYLDFGIYVLVVNFGRMIITMSYLGIDWAAFRYLPQFYAASNAAALRRLLATLIGLRAAIVLLLAAVGILLASPLSDLVGAPNSADALRLYFAVVIADAIGEFVRLKIFSALLRQGFQLVSQLTRSAVHVAILLVLTRLSAGEIPLSLVIESEICAAMLSLVVVAAQLWLLDRQHTRDFSAAPGEGVLPGIRALLRFGFYQYVNDVIVLLGEGPTVSVIGANFVGLSGLAMFGFARNLAQQLQKVMPAENFIYLVWPKLILSYSVSRGFDQLMRHTMLVVKLSNIILAAAICALVVYGREVAEIFSGGKFGDAYGLVLVFAAWLFAQSQCIAVYVIATTVERVDALRFASLATAITTVPVALALLALGLGPYALAAALVAGQVAYVAVACWRLGRAGYRVFLDVKGHGRILIAAVAGLAAGLAIKALLPPGLPWLVVGGATIGLVFAIAIRLLRPFDLDERRTLERFVGRPIPLL
jgi:O-antigen/teichoic acid export membrane protein